MSIGLVARQGRGRVITVGVYVFVHGACKSAKQASCCTLRVREDTKV